MKKLSLALALLLALLTLLTGCSSDNSNTITVYNWEDYIDPAALEMFTEETGIEVKYVRFTTNEEMFIKLARGGGSYDVAFPRLHDRAHDQAQPAHGAGLFQAR